VWLQPGAQAKRRSPCGWKITKPTTEIDNFKSLLRALNSDCWVVDVDIERRLYAHEIGKHFL
jgi:hypothetical protein